MRVRSLTDADRQVIAAINRRDPDLLADALEEGGGSARSCAIRLLISAITIRPKDTLHLRPARGKRLTLLSRLGVSAWNLRTGLPPEARIELIHLLRTGAVQIGKLRQRKRGPRSDRAFIPKLWLDGWRVQQLINDLACEDARKIASVSPRGTIVPVVMARGLQKRAIDLFIQEQPQLSMSPEHAARYAKRALRAVQKLDLGSE